MSIRTVQTKRVLEDVTHAFYASGTFPTLNHILSTVAEYFSQYPVGSPLPLYLDSVKAKEISNVEKFNLMLAHMTVNLDTLYEVCLEHIEEIMQLTAVLQSDLNCLKTRRQRVETLIDDYMLSLYNTDGYYYSVSDAFTDTSQSDLGLTSAFVDTSIGAVVLPNISMLSSRLDPVQIGEPSIAVMVNGNSSTYIQVSPFAYALDNMLNTVWEIQVETLSQVAEVVVNIGMPMGTSTNPVTLSRIEFDPYGITPVQVLVNTGTPDVNNVTQYSGFGSQIATSLDKMSFMDSLRNVTNVKLTLRKTKADYIDSSSGTTKYRYIFGAKDISITQASYDSEAIFVSAPFSLPTELSSEVIIDAVSLVADADILADTNITYYVAADSAQTSPTIDDFEWKQIQPIGKGTNNVAHFEGAQGVDVYIRSKPEPNDLQLIALDATNTDLTKMNPNPLIFPGVDIYRIAALNDDYIVKSLSLEEGVNSTRIYSVDYDTAAVASLDYWAPIISAGTANITYGRTDVGKGFFYGGDIGENGKSIYVETYLESINDHELILADLRKADTNAQTWTVRVFLNGREIGWLPGRNLDTDDTTTGPVVDHMIIPWGFRRGLNHISMLINIPPAARTSVNSPYIGLLDIMAGKILSDFGTIKLATWSYVSLFDLQFNQTGQPFTFSIYNNEIVSRRNPSINFRLQYKKATSKGPLALRVRADLSRSVNNANVTPKLNSYRLRFSYA